MRRRTVALVAAARAAAALPGPAGLGLAAETVGIGVLKLVSSEAPVRETPPRARDLTPRPRRLKCWRRKRQTGLVSPVAPCGELWLARWCQVP